MVKIILISRYVSRRRAFTLAELLVTLAVFAVIAATLLSSLSIVVRRLEYLADYRKAANRAASVEAFLRAPVAYCGYGMPLESVRYRAAFGNSPYAPFSWDGPVSAKTVRRPYTDGNDRRRDNALFIAYAQAGTARVKRLTTLNAWNNTIPLERAPEPSEIDVSGPVKPLCKSFICLGSAVPPRTLLKVISSGKELKIDRSSFQNVTLQKGDEVRLFRAITVYAFQDRLYSYDFSGSGRQPRLSGVCDLRFQVDVAAGRLTAFVMTRGDKIYKARRPVKNAEFWPEEYAGGMYDNEANYMLLITKIVLELPNCQNQKILNTQDITEAFL